MFRLTRNFLCNTIVSYGSLYETKENTISSVQTVDKRTFSERKCPFFFDSSGFGIGFKEIDENVHEKEAVLEDLFFLSASFSSI